MTDEQRALRDAVRGLLTKHADSSAVRRAADQPRGYDEALWRRLCDEVGVAALAIPEKFDGAGAGLAETQLVLHELGRTLAPAPLLGSAVLCGQLLVELDDPDACARLLPALAAGTSIAALAWTDGPWTPAETPFTVDGGAGRATVSGTGRFVLDGDIADVLLVVARDTSGVGVYELAPGTVERTHTPTMDPTRRLATITASGVPATRIGTGDATAAVEAAVRHATVALAAEQVGAAERILERTVDYTRTRVQFGRPIGSFQALKHRMADLHVLVEAARSAAAAAAGTISAAAAHVWCSEALLTVAGECIQLHGGIAITWEHDAHLYFKRAHGSAQLFGQPLAHLPALAAEAGL